MARSLQDLLAEAAQLTAKKKYPQALGIYAEVCKANPRDFKAWMKIGDVLCLSGDKTQALSVYIRAARGLADGGDLLAAIAINRKILELDPKHTETQRRLGDLYAARAEAGQLREAEERLALAEALKKREAPKDASDGANVDVELKRAGAGEPAITTHRFDAAMPAAGSDSIEDVRQRLSELPETPLFSSLSPSEFAGVVPLLNVVDVPAGTIVIREGERGESLFIIAAGEATVSKLGPDRKETSLGSMTAGAFFGEIALFEGGVRSATVTAAGEMTLMEITRSAVAKLCAKFPDVKLALDRFYYMRLLRTVLKFNPAFRDLPEAHLVSLLGRFKHADLPAGQHIFGVGAAVGGLIVLESGAVLERGEHGARQLRGGDFVGIHAFLNGQPLTVRYEAAAQSRLYQLPRDLYATLIARYPKVDAELRKFA